MKFLIVEPSPLPIVIPLGPKYSPQDIYSTTVTVKNTLRCGAEVWILKQKYENQVLVTEMDYLRRSARISGFNKIKSRVRKSMDKRNNSGNRRNTTSIV